MITQHGAYCDVGDHYILPLGEHERVHFFEVAGIMEPLCCCNAHRKLLVEEIGLRRGDWKKLPPGPLRRAFEAAERRTINEPDSNAGN